MLVQARVRMEYDGRIVYLFFVDGSLKSSA